MLVDGQRREENTDHGSPRRGRAGAVGCLEARDFHCRPAAAMPCRPRAVVWPKPEALGSWGLYAAAIVTVIASAASVFLMRWNPLLPISRNERNTASCAAIGGLARLSIEWNNPPSVRCGRSLHIEDWDMGRAGAVRPQQAKPTTQSPSPPAPEWSRLVP